MFAWFFLKKNHFSNSRAITVAVKPLWPATRARALPCDCYKMIVNRKAQPHHRPGAQIDAQVDPHRVFSSRKRSRRACAASPVHRRAHARRLPRHHHPAPARRQQGRHHRLRGPGLSRLRSRPSAGTARPPNSSMSRSCATTFPSPVTSGPSRAQSTHVTCKTN